MDLYACGIDENDDIAQLRFDDGPDPSLYDLMVRNSHRAGAVICRLSKTSESVIVRRWIDELKCWVPVGSRLVEIEDDEPCGMPADIQPDDARHLRSLADWFDEEDSNIALRFVTNNGELQPNLRRIADALDSIMIPSDIARVSGEMICETCGQPYRKHSHSHHRDNEGRPYLRVTCDGRLIKI